MKRLLLACVLALVLAGCGGSKTTSENTAASPADSPAASSAPASEEATASASGCTASGLDAMTALSDFQLEMDAAQKAGKLTVDQLVAARDKLFNATQGASAKNDWAGYCQAIDDMRKELAL